MTFVLVHGIWHGGWCWRQVADILRDRGHQVTAPTHTGLGERSHLLSESITLETFIEDIVNHLKWSQLRDVVLVGHSFAGAVIIGVADRVPERIASLVFLDAAIMEDGETWFGLLPKEIAEDRLAKAQATSGGVSLPVPPPQSFGVTDPDQVAYLEQMLTPHPLATCTTPLKLEGPPGNGLPLHYIVCTNPTYPPAAAMHERARRAHWPISELATGHDAMVIAPQETADMLEKVAINR
jgi:pimeloyl-ACP methyl ester carboxylesterase